MDSCSKFLNQHRVTDIFTDVTCFHILLVLTHNNIVFDDNNYLGNSGAAIGTKISIFFASLFMTYIGHTFVEISPLKLLLYMWFIDDIFII